MSDWWRGAVVYQIYPRSFCDSNGDGVGDLRGVIEKLDHVASLGVDAIWLSPFFRSPMKDYGYDVSDYRDVDPLFGSLADADALIKRAHELGLKVIIDQVWSHSSDQHPWFAESRASRDNLKADWYVWADAKPDGSPPNNWQAMFGGPSWTWDSRRRQYYLHNFLIEQPDLNVRNAAVQDALLDTARFWLERGVDGFRLDVVNFLIHDAQLRDNLALAPPKPRARPHQYQRHLYDRTQPETLEFIARLRALLDEYGAMAVGEIEDEEPLKVQRDYTEGDNRLHTAYSFFLLRTQKMTPLAIKEAVAQWDGARGWPSWSLSNHDVARFPTRLAGEDPQRTKLMLTLLLCLRGTVFLYQGDELGLSHADVPFERLRDPEAIAFWPSGIGRDGARTPMPWRRESPMAGFTSAGDAWLPLDPRHRTLAVDAQESDPASMLNFTRALLALRKAHGALRDGVIDQVSDAEAMLSFVRQANGERLVCLFNLGDAPASAALPPTKDVLLQVGDARTVDGQAQLGGYSALIVAT
ncbi:MAG TPA: alpha-amylase family glycosyl hydrolase [Candidatus Binatia bacterium]|nr:alpha-amylase family glycosyl hydrolase [Candidatus Binatia bacterium]